MAYCLPQSMPWVSKNDLQQVGGKDVYSLCVRCTLSTPRFCESDLPSLRRWLSSAGARGREHGLPRSRYHAATVSFDSRAARDMEETTHGGKRQGDPNVVEIRRDIRMRRGEQRGGEVRGSQVMDAHAFTLTLTFQHMHGGNRQHDQKATTATTITQQAIQDMEHNKTAQDNQQDRQNKIMVICIPHYTPTHQHTQAHTNEGDNTSQDIETHPSLVISGRSYSYSTETRVLPAGAALGLDGRCRVHGDRSRALRRMRNDGRAVNVVSAPKRSAAAAAAAAPAAAPSVIGADVADAKGRQTTSSCDSVCNHIRFFIFRRRRLCCIHN